MTDQPQNVVAALALIMGEIGGIEKLNSAQRAQRGRGSGDCGVPCGFC